MKWPWVRRAEAAESEAAEAERRLEETHRQWPEVRAIAGETRYHRELNGWTATVKTIFSG